MTENYFKSGNISTVLFCSFQQNEFCFYTMKSCIFYVVHDTYRCITTGSLFCAYWFQHTNQKNILHKQLFNLHQTQQRRHITCSCFSITVNNSSDWLY